MENKKVKISDLRKVKGIGEKTIERVKEQFSKGEYISKYNKDLHLSKGVIHHGDCLELMSGIPDKSVDMVLCDLPYGTSACPWDTVIDFDKLWRQYNRVIKDSGAIVLFGSEPFSSQLRNSNLIDYKYDWVWVKSRCGGFFDVWYRPLKNYENISVFGKGGVSNGSGIKMEYNPQGVLKLQTPRKRTRKGLSSIVRTVKEPEGKQEYTNYPKQVLEFESPANPIHPTQKPVELLKYLIKTYTKEGDIVLDNCMGSGSTAVAAIKTNREYIGIELEEDYVNMANKRVEKVR